MKRTLAMLLALALLLVLPACGSGDPSVTTGPADPWSSFTSYATLDEAVASLNPQGIAVVVVDTTDADAMAALDLDFEVIAHDAFVIDPSLVSEATLLRQSELVGQNPYELGGWLLFAEGVALPAFYIEPETFITHPTYSARIDVDSYRVYPMRNSSFVTRYKEWTNETYAELKITAEEHPDLADAALAAADEAAILLRSFDNRPPITGDPVSTELDGCTISYILPDEWILGTETQTGANTIAFFHTASVEENAAGMLFSLVLTDDANLGSVVTEGDETYVVATYPTDTQYYVSTMTEYLNLQAMIPDILYTVTVE